MASSAKRRYRTSLIIMLVLVTSIWGVIIGLGLKPKLGLDLQGGVSVVLTAKGTPSAASIDKAVDIIRQRVDGLGVGEPDISRQGSNVLVQLPGIKEQKKALDLIGKTAQLFFRPVLAVLTPGSPDYMKATPPDCTDTSAGPDDDPTQVAVLCARAKNPNTGQDEPASQWQKLVLGPASLGGSDVSGATATLPGSSTAGLQWQVDLNL